ncbi:peroxisomal sarcosine oxidase isoform X3 [Globicephala melas]|uniref:peroxisomal sarcosine oxidase isoform X3 n=1 Tax=Globicephala melas TaxID=9731 RepID=UPI00293D311D|nr:peroxisomal sarcosine oxidase isoform X3 [Globicephala melas]
MAAQKDLYDAIVIGAGIQGCFTAYHLAKHRKRVLLLEQFFLPHSRGSSHGQSRIIRRAYPEDFYTQMMAECYQIWAQLEHEAGTQLYRQTGLLLLGMKENAELKIIQATLSRQGVEHQCLPSEELKQRFPNIRLARGEVGLLEKSGGVLYADKALRALQTLRINVCYWREKVPGSYGVSQAFPCFLGFGLAPYHIYGLPSGEYPGLMKVCYHHGNNADPEERDCPAAFSDIQDVHILSCFVRDHLPNLEPEPAVMEHCMYTNTPDEHFILDRHPKYDNIVIGAGFSGHGFKLSPVVGKILYELSMKLMPSYDLTPFRISRFPRLGKAHI